ncbi:MAG: Formiminotransferase-cyclodeaminase [Chloroflexi bacterium]|nr:Formiminotransferase-cyclodeaminase [Chloroflexota bacterium]
MHGASEVPVQTAEAARLVLDLAVEAAEIMNVTVLGDVAVAAHVALAAARSGADQADLNLSTLGDEAFVSSLRSRLKRALEGGDSIVEKTVATVRRRAAA